MSESLVHCLLFALCILHLVCGTNDERPRIQVSNGNLIIKPALNKNIVLSPNGPRSSVLISGIDVTNLVTSQSSSSREKADHNTYDATPSNDIVHRIEQLETQLTIALPILAGNSTLTSGRIRRLRTRITILERQLAEDHCKNSPCTNGGTCLNLVFGYHCLCTSGWEGTNCDVDVNECRHFAGTDLGCQNGATCNNQPGSYECLCRTGWYGLHCTRKAQDCFGGDFEMCGHGSCIPVSTGAGIKCICDQGWTHNETSISCLTDINECESSQGPRCSANPKVDCINLPGSFKCGSCPAGYQGDGFSCSDIDECFTLNGGCSISPMVSCYNTVGSRICGQCPSGYVGDGITCTWQGSCSENKGGCHPSAQCVESPGINGQNRYCVCPEGMTGDGVGIHGCSITTDNNATCADNPCGVHGRCHRLLNGYTCICYKGFIGAHCENPVDYCSFSPCQNGGSCRRDGSRLTGFKCECSAQFSGDLCQVHSKLCGGVLDAEEGNIVYPLDDNNNYNHNARCAWVIHTAPDKVINVTFSKFDIESHPDCPYDFLQIHDGRSSASQFIGRFCGDVLPKGGNIISSHNNIYLWFRSDQTVAKKGFALHWNSINPTCGGEIDAKTYGHISSPGSPGKYPPNRDCFWHLYTIPGKRIQLHFFEIDIQSSANCSYDYVNIYDGTSITDPLLNKYCNLTQPAPLTSFGSDLVIHFHSDSIVSGNGFQISYATVAGIPGCGGYFTSERGELVAPTVEGQYLNNLVCEYEIRTSPDTRIQMRFDYFRLESSSVCQYDYLKLYDGASSNSRLVGKFCGNSYPRTFVTSTNTAFLIFRSDVSISSGGFKISYESVCRKNFTGDSGIITSPGYPLSYPDDKVCEYVISAIPGKAIQLTIQEFDFEDFRWRGCVFDFIEIRDGLDSAAPLLGKFCGSVIPPVQTSTHNYMYIKFSSDHSISGAGMYANYTTIDIACGGIFRETTGLINHPPDTSSSYDNSQKCSWILIAPPGYHIMVTWNRLELENSLNCEFDYVELAEINESSEKSSLGKYCGRKRLPALTTNTNKLNITFVSDGTFINRGFSLSYSFLNDRSHCGGLYATETGHIFSPGWPGNYEANLDCTWIIRVPIGQQVQLTTKRFQIESAVAFKCDFGDYLEIRNGAHENAAVIGKFCGSTIPKLITSMSNSLYLHFHSDLYVSGSGFQFEWNGAVKGCGGTLTSSSGTLTSPNYPQIYDNNAECFFRIVTSHGSLIKIVFSELDLEVSHDCTNDYVEIFDGRESSAPSLGRFCQLKENTVTIQSSSNYAFIKFRSDFSSVGKGFSLNYYTICQNVNLTGTNGIIESPDYPSIPPTSLNCYWNIQVPKGNKINVTFTDLNIHGRLGRHLQFCSESYVQLVGSNNSNKLCVRTDVGLETSIDNKMQIKFVTNSWIFGSGFRLEWTRYGCGGHIQKPFGRLTFDKSLPLSAEIDCEWLLETPIGTSISITVTDVYMLDTPNCTTDYIEFYGSQTDDSNLITKLCNKGISSAKSGANYMFIKFVKKSTLRDVYLSLTFDSKTATCGGAFVSRFGVIYSKNYPKNYYNNLNCKWLLSVPQDSRLVFNIIDLDLYDSPSGLNKNSSCGDQIRLYDIANLNNNYSVLICPNSNLTSYTAKSNMISVQFVTDAVGTAKGFKANFTAICGGRISGKIDGILKSYDAISLSNCSWTINAPQLNQKISLTITYLSINMNITTDSTKHCPSSFLKVLDGDDTDAPILGEFCGRKVPPMIVSRGSALTIVHGSYDGLTSGKFSAHYSTVDMACGGKIVSEEGVIASPNFPQSYSKNLDCEWVISASLGNKIYVTFENFDINDSEGCNQDYLEIRETNGIGRLLGVYCGNEVPANMSMANNLYIKFHSGSNDPRQGFILHYGYVHENEISNTDEGFIASPLYPHIYEATGEYTWRIISNGASSIDITVQSLEIPSATPECQNKLLVYDGFDEDAPVLKEFCGILKNNKEEVVTSSNTAYIKLQLANHNTGALFLLKWKRTRMHLEKDATAKCGSNSTEIISGNETIIMKSPNYPENYDDDMNCEWVYKSLPGEHLEISFQDFSLEESDGCFADYVSVYSAKLNIDYWKPVIEKGCNSSIINKVYVGADYLKIKFVTDSSFSGRGFIARINSQCGGTISNTAGVISPSRYMTRTRFQLDCEWTVKVRPGRTINLNFDYFNITNPDDRCTNYVILRNGETSESPSLASGKYCGYAHERKADIRTSTNAAHITYSSRGSQSRDFRLRFEERNVECGGTIQLGSDHSWEVISSPNYPSVPVPYTECEWKISGPRGENVRIDIIDRFDLESNPECTKEFLEIRNGLTYLSPLVGRYCGVKPSTIKTNANTAFIKYSTDIPEPRNGFKANVSIDTCGGTLIADSGELSSPYYPNLVAFTVGSMCEWHVVTVRDHILTIQIHDSSLPPTTTPCQTNVTIEEKNPINSSYTIIKTICGPEDQNTLVQTLSNEFKVTMYYGIRTPGFDTTQYRGFHLTFNSSRLACGGTISASEGYLTSPGYPRTTSLRYCHWLITLPDKSRRIKLEIEDADFNQQRLSLYNDIFFQSLIETLPNAITNATTSFESSGNKMSLILVSTGLVRNHRFKAKFSSNDAALCGGTISGLSGVILSPALERSYKCEWLYLSEDDNDVNKYNTLFITGTMTSSSPYSQCRFFESSLSITATLKHNFLSQKYCGNVSIALRIPSNQSPVNVKSIQTRQRIISFHLKYQKYPCGGQLVVIPNPTNILEIPDSFNGSLDCAWELSPSSNERMELKLEGYFKLGCSQEYLKISQGFTRGMSVIGDYCVDRMPQEPLVVRSYGLFVEYHTEQNSSGIKLLARSVNNDDIKQCGAALGPFQKTFTSPNYPKNYNPNQECSWYMTVDSANRISLSFIERFVIEYTLNCTKDVLIVYDWRDQDFVQIARLCGRDTPPVFNSTLNKMKVTFRTDADINLDGFKGTWKPICGTNLVATETEQFLYSPGYPMHYPPLTVCNYQIDGGGQRVQLKLLDFTLEGTYPLCLYDNLTITGYVELTESFNEVLCGTEKSDQYFVANSLHLLFRSDRFLQRKGFKISYSLRTCGGTIKAPTIISSGLDGDYEDDLNCTWYIEAPATKIIVIKFSYIDMENVYGCDTDFVAIYEGNLTIPENRLALLCGHINSTTVIRSVGNIAILQFVTDFALSYKGFKAEVLFSHSEAVGCGGNVHVTNSVSFVESPLLNHSVLYEKFLDCHWTIHAPSDKAIRIEFTSFHIAPCRDVNQTALGMSLCNCDSVEIRDGVNPKSFLMGKFCGHTLPPTLTSSENRISIRLSTDGEIESSGFKARISLVPSACGQKEYRVSNDAQVIKTPGYDTGIIPRGLHCSYILQGTEYRTLHLQIKDIDLAAMDNETNVCSKDKLIIQQASESRGQTGKDLILRSKEPGSVGFFLLNSYVEFPQHFIFCGANNSLDLYISGSVQLNVITSPTMEEPHHKGFSVQFAYSGFCSRNYTEPQGRIHIHTATNDLIRDCYILITAPENYTISLYFISIFQSYGYDAYLEIFDGNTTKSNSLGRPESDTVAIFSTSRYILLYNKASEVGATSFSLVYMTTDKGRGCGGKIFDILGVVTSPLYPDVYRNVGTCEWEIETTVGTRVNLDFKVFDLGNSCNKNYLEIVNRKGEVFARYCSEPPATYKSEDNYVKIVFRTDKNNGGSGWVAEFVGVM